MESISPNIFVKDIQKTIEFYNTLGFEVKDAVPDKDNPIFVLMTCGRTTFMFQTFGSIGDELQPISRQDGGSLLLYIKMTGINDFYEKKRIKYLYIKVLKKLFMELPNFRL